MKFAELKFQVEQIEPSLSEEGKMLVSLFMPFCELQQQRIRELEDQLAKHSGNSSKPPSQDTFRSPKDRSMRKTSNNKAGGQHGHKGQGGKLKDKPDDTILLTVDHCPDCDFDLRQIPAEELIRRQIEELPPIKTLVTEYQLEVKTCPCCAQRLQATGCPIANEFEYGPRLKSFAVYLSAFQFIPQGRIKDLLSLFGANLSTGSLNNFRRAAANELSDFKAAITQTLIKADAAHFDETGIKVDGENHWIHVCCTKMFSLFTIHRRRGKIAHDEMGVLPHFTGTAHRDGYKSYDDYPQFFNSLCNAHHIRELKFAIERDGQEQWAKPMIELLLKIKKQVDASPRATADIRWQGRYIKEYQHLVDMGLKLNPAAQRPDGQIKGRTKQSKTHNLLTRLRDRQDDVLRFMTEPMAKFDNNQAERDLRMNKVRAKVSGGFRSIIAAEQFMLIRSLVSTAIKQAFCPMQILMNVFTLGNKEYLKLATYPD